MWYRSFREEGNRLKDRNLPIVLCGNKYDLPKEKKNLDPALVTLHQKYNIPYVTMSTKEEWNCELPLLLLIRKLFPQYDEQSIDLVKFADCPPPPPEVSSYQEQTEDESNDPPPLPPDVSSI